MPTWRKWATGGVSLKTISSQALLFLSASCLLCHRATTNNEAKEDGLKPMKSWAKINPLKLFNVRYFPHLQNIMFCYQKHGCSSSTNKHPCTHILTQMYYLICSTIEKSESWVKGEKCTFKVRETSLSLSVHFTWDV